MLLYLFYICFLKNEFWLSAQLDPQNFNICILYKFTYSVLGQILIPTEEIPNTLISKGWTFFIPLLLPESKELSIWNKIKYLNPNIFRTRWCKPLIFQFQIQIIWFNRIHSLNYLRSTIFGFKDIVIIKSEFVARSQFLYKKK